MWKVWAPQLPKSVFIIGLVRNWNTSIEASWSWKTTTSDSKSIQDIIIILFRNNVHLTKIPAKVVLFLFAQKKCSLCYACNYFYLFIVVVLIILIKTMFLDSFSLHRFCLVAQERKKKKKRSVFCYVYSFGILFLAKYILPVHFSLIFCPNRCWKQRLLMQTGYSEVWCLL